MLSMLLNGMSRALSQSVHFASLCTSFSLGNSVDTTWSEQLDSVCNLGTDSDVSKYKKSLIVGDDTECGFTCGGGGGGGILVRFGVISGFIS